MVIGTGILVLVAWLVGREALPVDIVIEGNTLELRRPFRPPLRIPAREVEVELYAVPIVVGLIPAGKDYCVRIRHASGKRLLDMRTVYSAASQHEILLALRSAGARSLETRMN
ncbi:MAG: hypothetical protein QOE92_793 [Chloroflexota bacterium]|nr:hypothetical protein [Chloroflexota bacterium]